LIQSGVKLYLYIGRLPAYVSFIHDGKSWCHYFLLVKIVRYWHNSQSCHHVKNRYLDCTCFQPEECHKS